MHYESMSEIRCKIGENIEKYRRRKNEQYVVQYENNGLCAVRHGKCNDGELTLSKLLFPGRFHPFLRFSTISTAKVGFRDD